MCYLSVHDVLTLNVEFVSGHTFLTSDLQVCVLPGEGNPEKVSISSFGVADFPDRTESEDLTLYIF